MPRWLWFAPLAGLTALLAVGVYRLSGWTSQITETDVIQLAADRYREDAQADGVTTDRDTDCVARPGAPPAWITVTCVNDVRTYVYDLDRVGRFLVRPVTGPST
jgi:hypothetical protein